MGKGQEGTLVFLEECGDAQCRVPTDRTGCKTRETAPRKWRVLCPSHGQEVLTSTSIVPGYTTSQSHVFGTEWWNDNRTSMVKIKYCVCTCYVGKFSGNY